MPYRDPVKLRAAQRRHYERNREAMTAKVKRQRDERRAIVDEYKLVRGCSRCGYNKSAVALDAHHPTDDKTDGGVAKLVKDCKAISQILAELEKCEIVCANCHRELHGSFV